MTEGSIIKFSGHSDDVICVEVVQPKLGKVDNDEITAKSESPTKILVETIGGSRGVYVFAHYDGCWHFSVCQLEEGRKIPNNWEITTDQMVDHDYSAQLTIDAFKLAGDVLTFKRVDDSEVEPES